MRARSRGCDTPWPCCAAVVSHPVNDAVLLVLDDQFVHTDGDAGTLKLECEATWRILSETEANRPERTLRIRLRAGTYLEPTRFETSDLRPHYTGGFDVRVGSWNVFGLWPDDYQWRLAVGGDLARDYFTLGVTDRRLVSAPSRQREPAAPLSRRADGAVVAEARNQPISVSSPVEQRADSHLGGLFH